MPCEPIKTDMIIVDVRPDPDDDQILLVDITDLYPCITVHIYYMIRNDGSVPWVVNDYQPVIDFPGTVTLTPIDLIGTQVDPGQCIRADLEVHLTNAAEEDSTYSFSIPIRVVQWNEYPQP